MDSNIRETAIRVMREGGNELCQSARAKWYRGDYGNCPKQREAALAHWAAVKKAVAELATRLRKEDAA
jgi:hypothetical protein